MNRIVSLVIALALILTLAVTAEAGKKKKKKNGGSLVGTITAVSEDGKSFTVTSLTGKKKNAPTTELKITDKTKVEYIGVKDLAERKLTIGYVVIVAVDENEPGNAAVVAVGKAAVKTKKKKKNEE